MQTGSGEIFFGEKFSKESQYKGIYFQAHGDIIIGKWVDNDHTEATFILVQEDGGFMVGRDYLEGNVWKYSSTNYRPNGTFETKDESY